MITRWAVVFLAVCAARAQESQDAEDWVPISKPEAARRASPRVLNLQGAPKNYYQNGQFEEYQKPSRSHQQPPPLLPQSLQRFIYQGEPFAPRENQYQTRPEIREQYLQPPPQQQPLNQYQLQEPPKAQQYQLQEAPKAQQYQPPKVHNGTQKPEVQLLYVPLETLQRQQQRGQGFSLEGTATQAYQASEPQPVHKYTQLQNIEQDFVRQALQAHKFQQDLESYSPAPAYFEATTAAPKKRKPHQPPLAMYMRADGHDVVRVNDVLNILKDAKTISVQDTAGSDSPKVFVGPSNLNVPQGYVKFDLPYLSSLDTNRVERKVESLPFFVAPLSYKAPSGYAKIPFPAPHVGSVVVNQIPDVAKHTEGPNLPRPVMSSTYVEPITPRPKYRTSYTPDVKYGASTEVTEIPYGPLSTKLPHESRVSSNPYGPTPVFTTPSYFNPLQTQRTPIVEIKQSTHRFTTPSQRNVEPPRVSQAVEYSPIPVASTRSPPKDKYTVLEQFPINKPQEERRQTALPLAVHRAKQSNNPFGSTNDKTLYNQPESQVRYTTDDTLVYGQFDTSSPSRYVTNDQVPYNQPDTVSGFVPIQNTYEQTQISPRPQVENTPEVITQTHTEPAPKKRLPQANNQFVYKEPEKETQTQYHGEVSTQGTTVHRGAGQKLTQPTVQQPAFTESVYSPTQVYAVRGKHEHVDGEYKYSLPDDLPPINPQLPGLINSLQDQSLRPLLAPLLVPTYNTAGTELVTEEEVATEPATKATTTTTQAPPTRSRTRGRYRATRPTTPSYETTTHSRIPAHRRRRPTSTRARPEPQRTTNVVTTVRPETVREVSKTDFTRHHFDSYSSSTESTKVTVPSRQRFRTRGRPLKETMFSTESSEEAQPKLHYQGGFAEDYAKINHEKPPAENQESNEQYLKQTITYAEAPREQDHTIKIEITPAPTSERTRYVPDRDESSSEPYYTRSRTRSRTRARTQKPATTESSEEVRSDKSSEEEFYGFFRTPNFKKPVAVELKQSDEFAPTASPVYVQGNTYEDPQTVQTTKYGYLPLISEDGQSQNSYKDDSKSSEEVDDKPITHRPAYVRVEETTTLQPIEYFDTTSRTTEKLYTVRPSKRPEAQTQRVTRIRGRLRKPTRPPTAESQSSEEHVPVYHSRGKTHYKHSDGEKFAQSDISEENYPVSFLKAHAQTEKPAFRLTIEPEQESYDSSYTSKETIRNIEEAEESQVSTKIVERPQNFNTIDADDQKKKTTTDAPQIETTTYIPEFTTDTADAEVTTVEDVTTKKTTSRRRGVWRLKSYRPVDMLESAESQNIGEFVLNNIFGEDKEYSKVKFVTEEAVTDATTLQPEILTFNPKDDAVNVTTEFTNSDILEPLFSMFGFNSEPKDESVVEHDTESLITTTIPDTTIFPETEEPVINDQFPNILGTSTSTEISHETEICYRGRCVKSKLTPESSDSSTT